MKLRDPVPSAALVSVRDAWDAVQAGDGGRIVYLIHDSEPVRFATVREASSDIVMEDGSAKRVLTSSFGDGRSMMGAVVTGASLELAGEALDHTAAPLSILLGLEADSAIRLLAFSLRMSGVVAPVVVEGEVRPRQSG